MRDGVLLGNENGDRVSALLNVGDEDGILLGRDDGIPLGM